MATDIIARGMITEYIAGTNINFTENRDGTVEISASGSISSEDSVARDAINNHKSDTSNPHNVTPAQIGLGNVDNTSDLDKPISTAVQKAIDNKADKTVATTSADGLMSAEDKSKLDDADNTYALKSKYGNSTINVGRKAGTTIGDYSTAEGYNTTASGVYSHAGGLYTKALHNNEVAFGKYNESKDDTLYSIGDGTDDKARHNAFEITTTGGKLHDKDIATTDLIPTSLPADGGNADYAANADKLDGLHAEGFIKANGSYAYDCNTLYDAGLYLCNGSSTNTPNDLKYGTLFVMPYRRPYGNNAPDYCAQLYIPNGDADNALWFRTSLQNTWNEWKRSCDGGNADTVDGLHANDFYTSGNKPYVTGSVSISYSTESQNFEFLNFTPSAVICRYASRYENDGTIKWATPITNGFKVNVSSTEATSLDYIAFR